MEANFQADVGSDKTLQEQDYKTVLVLESG